MQSWSEYFTDTENSELEGSCNKFWNKYKSEINPDCKLYSFDLTGYGTCLFPEDSVFTLAGISDKVFGIMSKLETNRNAFIEEIEKVNI